MTDTTPPDRPQEDGPPTPDDGAPTGTGRTRFLERVLYLSDQIHLNQDLPEVGERLCEALGTLMGWGRVSFSVRDPETGGTRMVATHGFGLEERIIALGRAPARIEEPAWWEQEAWSVDGLFLIPPDGVPGPIRDDAWKDDSPKPDDAPAPFGMLVVPLRTRGLLLGVMVLENPVAPEAFGPAALEAFRVLSHIGARAIENARILDAERELVRGGEDHARFLDSLLKLGQSTLGEIHLDDVGDRVCRVISEQLGWSRVAVTVRDEEMGRARVVACRGFSRAEEYQLLNEPGRLEPGVPWYRDSRYRISQSYFVPAEEYRQLEVEPGLVIFSEHEPRVQPDAWQTEDFLIVPLESGGRQVGAVSVDDPASGTRPKFVEIRALELVANAAAAAVGNAHALETARAAQAEWEAVFGALDDGMAVLDQDGRITRANPSLGTLVGRDPEELAGLQLRALAPSEDRLARLEALVATAEGAFPSVPEGDLALEVPMAGRLVRIAAFVMGPRTVVVFTDLTRQRIVQSQMVQAERMMALGELMTGVAHDLNNPLTSVVGFSQLLVRDETTAAEAERMVELILSEANEASQLVTSLLRFSQHADPHPTACSPAVLLAEAVQLISHSARLSGVEIENHVAEDLPPVFVSAGAVELVLVSLAQNAVQIMEAQGGGVLRFRGETTEGSVVIHVDDSGPGVPERIRGEIFAPFYSTRGESGGSGLGLAVARSLTEQQGGRLDVGEAPDGGARFSLSLPAAGA